FRYLVVRLYSASSSLISFVAVARAGPTAAGAWDGLSVSAIDSSMVRSESRNLSYGPINGPGKSGERPFMLLNAVVIHWPRWLALNAASWLSCLWAASRTG